MNNFKTNTMGNETSGLGKFGWQDLLKGLYMAVLSSVGSTLIAMFNAQGWPDANQWNQVLLITAGAVVTYIVKVLTSNNEGTPLTKDK